MPSRSSSRGNGGSPAPIGVPRFELGTSPTRTERATRLRHTPTGERVAASVRRFTLGAKPSQRRAVRPDTLLGKTTKGEERERRDADRKPGLGRRPARARRGTESRELPARGRPPRPRQEGRLRARLGLEPAGGGLFALSLQGQARGRGRTPPLELLGGRRGQASERRGSG